MDQRKHPGVMTGGTVSPSEVAAGLATLDVACNRYERRGRLSVARLLAEHGADLPIPRLRWCGERPRVEVIADKMHDAYGGHFPGLSG
jgi:hypothetical protein